MKNVIKDKLERFNYLSVNSKQKKLSKDFCLNLVVELADLNSNIYSKKRKNVLVISFNPDKDKSRITRLQSRYFPECYLKKSISYVANYSITEYEYGDLNFNYKKLSDLIQRKDIKVVYIEGWPLSSAEFKKLKEFSKIKEIYIIHYLDYDNEIEFLDIDSLVITQIESYKYLCSYLKNDDEIISQKIPSSGFVHL